ncbi:hypothetical protein AAMO2058_000710600 [Amorphochlora amoebiformis]
METRPKRNTPETSKLPNPRPSSNLNPITVMDPSVGDGLAQSSKTQTDNPNNAMWWTKEELKQDWKMRRERLMRMHHEPGLFSCEKLPPSPKKKTMMRSLHKKSIRSTRSGGTIAPGGKDSCFSCCFCWKSDEKRDRRAESDS